MGQNGEQLVKADGTFGIHSDAKRILFDSKNTTCCCNGEPPDPPDGQPCPNVNIGGVVLPNTAEVRLGYSFSPVEAIATRQDLSSRLMFPQQTLAPPENSIYYVVIGAVKTGDNHYGTRTVVQKANGITYTEDWSDVANDLNQLKSGKTYYVGVQVTFQADKTITAYVGLLPYRYAPTNSMQAAFTGAFMRQPVYYAFETQDWKDSLHPVGVYDFTFVTDRSGLKRGSSFGSTGTDISANIQHDMNMFNCTIEIKNGTVDIKTPQGGSLVFVDHPCRKPYHAASGENAYASSQSSDGQEKLNEPWMYKTRNDNSIEISGSHLDFNIKPYNGHRIPPEFVSHFSSGYGFSGFHTKAWNVSSTNTQSNQKFFHTYKLAGKVASLTAPYDIRATYTAEFSVRNLNFKYNQVSTGGFSYFTPPFVSNLFNITGDQSLVGCNGIGLYRATGTRFDRIGIADVSGVFTLGANLLGNDPILAPLNTYPLDETTGAPEDARLAKQGEVKFKLVYTFSHYTGDSSGHRMVWDINIFADGTHLGVVQKDSTQAFGHDSLIYSPFFTGKKIGSTVSGRVVFNFSGDNVNVNAMPTLTFSALTDGQAQLATNSNQPFNSGIYDFSLTHDAEFFDSGFKGDVEPYTPIFDYAPEGIGNSHWNLIKGRSYTFRIIDQFQMTDLQGFFCNDNMLPIGMTLDQSTGTISGTPEGNDSGTIIIHGTDAFDRTYNRSFDFRVDNGTTETPQT